MTPIPPLLLFVVLILLFIVGWFAIAHRDRLHRRGLESAVTKLETDVATFNEKMKHDPQRAGIDLGKRYAVNEMEATLERLRREESR